MCANDRVHIASARAFVGDGVAAPPAPLAPVSPRVTSLNRHTCAVSIRFVSVDWTVDVAGEGGKATSGANDRAMTVLAAAVEVAYGVDPNTKAAVRVAPRFDPSVPFSPKYRSVSEW